MSQKNCVIGSKAKREKLMNYRTHYGSDALITRRLDYSKRLLSVNQFNKSAAGVLTKTRRTPITRFF